MEAIARAFRERPILYGAIALFLLLLICYTASIGIRASRGASITGDEPFYLLTTQSILDDGNLDLKEQYERESYESFFDHPDGLWKQSVPNDDGVLLSPHNPGLSLYVIPGFVIGGLEGVQMQLLLTAALTFALTFVLTARLTKAPLISWLATLAVGLTAAAFIYSTEVYPEVTAAALLVGAMLLLAREERPGMATGLAVMALLTVMVWFGVKYAPLAALAGGLFMWRAGNRERLTFAGLGLLSAAFFAWWHIHTFGELTPYSVNTVYAGESTTGVVSAHVGIDDRFYRLWGIFIDRRFGIGRWAPVLFLALPGVFLLLKANIETRVIAGLVAVQLLIATFVAITMMGWWFPGRTMMTVLPLFAVPIALLLRDNGRWARPLFGVLFAYSLVITAALAYAGHSGEITIAVDPFDMDVVPFTVASGLFPQYTSWGTETNVLNALWLGIGGLLLGAFGSRTLLPPSWREWVAARRGQETRRAAEAR